MNRHGSRLAALRAATMFSLGAVLLLSGCTPPAGNAQDSSSTQATPSAAVQPSPGASTPPEAAPASADPTGHATLVPAPSGGTINQVIPAAAPGPVTQVGLDETADLPNEIAINIDQVEAIEATASTPGEIAGPAVAMHVSIRNGSSEAINVDSVMVALTDSANALGQPTTSAPYQPFAGELAAGASAQGVYVFLVPTDDRRGMTLSVAYTAGQASAEFVGDVS